QPSLPPFPPRRSSDLDRDILTRTVAIDVRFDDFLADQVGAVEKILALAGEEFTDDARSGVAGYLESHTRGHLGRVAYRPGQVGQDRKSTRLNSSHDQI